MLTTSLLLTEDKRLPITSTAHQHQAVDQRAGFYAGDAVIEEPRFPPRNKGSEVRLDAIVVHGGPVSVALMARNLTSSKHMVASAICGCGSNRVLF